MLTRLYLYLNKYKTILITTLIFFLLRIILLDHAYLLRGERDISLTGYFIAKTGRDLYGRLLPLEFSGLDMSTPLLAFYFSAFWWFIMPFKNVFFARLPFVLLTTFYLFFVYEIIYLITKKKGISLLTSLIFCFSPGIYHLSRLSLEVNLATPLLFLSIIYYLKNNKLYSYLFFILTYFSYNGFRPIIPFILIFLESYYLLKHKKTKRFIKNNIINISFFLILFLSSLIFIDGKMMSSRKTDLVFIGYNKIVPKVIYARNTAIGPEILKKVFFNKLTTTISYITDVFVKGQDLSYLFLNGDSAAIYASTFTGQFFLICLIFYYLGFIFLGKEFNKEYFYVLGFIPISLISSMVNIDYVSVAIRSILASVSFAFIIACGIIFFLDLIKKIKKSFRRVIYIFLAAFIFIELSYFVYNYFFRREITMFEMFFEHEKQISLFLNSNKKPYIIYDDSPRNILASYLFLNKDINITKAQKIFKQGIPYMYDGFIFKICPSSPKEIVLKNKMIIADSCTDEKLYQKLNGDSRVKKIPFQDFSSRTAFFIID